MHVYVLLASSRLFGVLYIVLADIAEPRTTESCIYAVYVRTYYTVAWDITCTYLLVRRVGAAANSISIYISDFMHCCTRINKPTGARYTEPGNELIPYIYIITS